MSKARLVITAVTIEKRPVSEVARSYGVARSWICTLLARYRAEGEAAFEPRSRRPKTSPSAISAEVIGLIARLRKELSGQGLDAGPHTIAWHLEHHHRVTVSPATVSRYLARAGLVTPDPGKRPRSSYLRFAAELPNECWQSGFTRYPPADGTDTEVLTWLDDHSRYALSVTAHIRVSGPIVLAAFRAAVACHGAPASALADGLVFRPPVRRQGRPQPPGSRNVAADLQFRVELRGFEPLTPSMRTRSCQSVSVGQCSWMPGNCRTSNASVGSESLCVG